MCFLIMLHISGKSSYYTVKPPSEKEERGVIPRPKIYNPIIMSFDQWYNKYKNILTEMSNYIVEKLWLLTSDKYIANFNASVIKKELVQLFYKTSYNRYRNYIV